MVMQPSNPGWSSTPMAGGASNVDTFSRIMAMRYGGRTDDIWSYLDQPGYRQELGRATEAPRGSWGTNLGSGSVKVRGMGSGGTPSDPGGYNYGTLENAARGARRLFAESYNFLADRRPGADLDLDFRFGNTPIYDQYRGKQQRIERITNIRARQQARAAAQAQQTQAAPTATGPYTGAFPTSYPSNPGLTIEQSQDTARQIQSQFGTSIAREQNPALRTGRRPGANAEVNILQGSKSSIPGLQETDWISSPAASQPRSSGNMRTTVDIWDTAPEGAQQMGQGTKPTTGRPTGAAGASQRPNQPRNRGRGKSNRGFGKKL